MVLHREAITHSYPGSRSLSECSDTHRESYQELKGTAIKAATNLRRVSHKQGFAIVLQLCEIYDKNRPTEITRNRYMSEVHSRQSIEKRL